MPQNPALQAFNAALLKQSPSSANMSNYDDIFSGPSEGHVPTAWEQFSGDRNADAAETALGAGPAVDALRHAMDEQRMQHQADLDAADSDFFMHGRDRALSHANVQNEVGDVLSEGSARRGFLPWSNQQHERAVDDAMTQSDARYGAPARIQAMSNLAAHQVDANSRVEAARVAHAPIADPVEAFKAALLKRFEAGYPITPEDIKQLQGAMPQPAVR